MSYWKSLVGILLVFAFGFLSGLAVSHLRPKRSPPEERVLSLMEHRLPHELELSESQRANLEEAINEAERELKALHKEMRPRVLGILLRVEDKLLPTLTGEQKEKYERISRKERERLERQDRSTRDQKD